MSLTITVRQTRNHQATDVQYIASKRIIIPDPGPQKMPFVSLSELGFGNPAQNFMAIPSSPGLSVTGGQHNGSQWLLLDQLRGTLSYNEELGPTLTVIELDDVKASQKWAKDQVRLQKKKRHADQVALLKWPLTYPWSCMKSVLTSPESNTKNFVSEANECVHSPH